MECLRIEIGMIFLLGVLVLEDFRKREVSVWILIVLTGCFLMKILVTHDWVFLISEYLMNLLFLALLAVVIWLFSLWTKRGLRDMIGAGDVCFMGVLALALPFPYFVCFMNLSFMMALIWWGMVKSERGIPLVGIQAFCYIIFLIGTWKQFLWI